MAGTSPRAAQLRRQAALLNDLADECDDPSRSIKRADRIIADIEQAAADVRAIARGR